METKPRQIAIVWRLQTLELRLLEEEKLRFFGSMARASKGSVSEPFSYDLHRRSVRMWKGFRGYFVFVWNNGEFGGNFIKYVIRLFKLQKKMLHLKDV